MKHKKLTKISTPIIAVLLAIAIAFTATPSSAVGVDIEGNGYYGDNSPANFDSVRIINTNTNIEWNQTTVVAVGITGNYYSRLLDYTNDINDGHILRIIATNGSSTNDSNITYNGGSGGLVYDITFPTPVIGSPDLIVQSVTPNANGLANYYLANESNDINATIKNNGTVNAGAFNVSFVVDSFSGQVRVTGGLIAGASTTVTVTDPTIRNNGTSVTIDVFADSNTEVSESNETNNNKSLTKTVYNNGWKGKRYTGGSDISSWKTFDLKGDLVYSVGDSHYVSGSTYPLWTNDIVNWTVGDLSVNGPVTEARLYVPFTYEKIDAATYTHMEFNGYPQTLDKLYRDQKTYSTGSPYGMLVYNVTDDFSISGNVANISNSWHLGGNISLRGMVLVVVYQNDSQPLRKIIINEEFDMLYGASTYSTTPAEATAYAPFGNIDTSTYSVGRLITMAPGAGPNEGELLVNDDPVSNNVWNYAGTTEIGIDDRYVNSSLHSTDNLVGFQSSADWMEASNAILVLETVPPTVTINQAIGQVDPTTASTINFTVVFSKLVTDFLTGDVNLSGTAVATTATVTGSGTTYNVEVSGMTATGTVIASIDAGKAHDTSGNANTPSTSSDNSVLFNKEIIIDLGVSYNTSVGSTITVPITANQFADSYGTITMEFRYDQSKFNVIAVNDGDHSTVQAYNDNPATGKLNISAMNTGGVTGDVVLANVVLGVEAGSDTSSVLTLVVKLLQDIHGETIVSITEPVTVNIRDPSTQIKVETATSTPVSSLGKSLYAILNDNGRSRHTGDNETVISAYVTGVGISTVTVNLAAIGGSSTTTMTHQGSGIYNVTAKATGDVGVNGLHNFVVTATDNIGRTATRYTNSLTIYRRGDVVRDNDVDVLDAYYIARESVGLETPNRDLFNFVGDVMPASGDSSHTVDMSDALYIARYDAGLEPAAP